MHPEDIKAEIRKAGTTPAAIARSLSVTSMAVTHAIRGNKSTRIAREIARVINKPFAVLWPGKYPEIEFVERLNPNASAALQGLGEAIAKTTRARRVRPSTTPRRKP